MQGRHFRFGGGRVHKEALAFGACPAVHFHVVSGEAARVVRELRRNFAADGADFINQWVWVHESLSSSSSNGVTRLGT